MWGASESAPEGGVGLGQFQADELAKASGTALDQVGFWPICCSRLLLWGRCAQLDHPQQQLAQGSYSQWPAALL